MVLQFLILVRSGGHPVCYTTLNERGICKRKSKRFLQIFVKAEEKPVLQKPNRLKVLERENFFQEVFPKDNFKCFLAGSWG